ncbi:la-related protein 6C-like isoform X2 [Oryza brachyantha]|uniref:la-related protein 6C-like isoform X2 n=1 Tax=Oryza brachyantha TaxID=4533 RepID=UPI001ADD4820|nr:la-related protein 6C-like isoform X2 [Oryza brachyantha]
MAQESRGSSGKAPAASSSSGECSTPPFRLNVHAPEFVPRSPAAVSPMAAAGFYSPFLQLPGSGIGLCADWSIFAEPDPAFFLPDFGHGKIAAAAGNGPPKGASPADIAQKIIKQVEYQFSDTNLVANDFLMKIMNKDPECYVPMSVISSWKKIKAMGVTNQLLVNALRTSSKLVVSDDGKKVRRAQPFTERHKEELQSRMVIAENLPEDSTRNSLEKIFGIIGSVKNIRICHPQEPSSARSSKSDALVSNKLHALIEYETSQQADRAVDKLNDERNWRKGLRVRPVLRRSPKSVVRLKRPDFDHAMISDDEHSPLSQVSSDSPMADHSPDHHEDHHGKKSWARGRGGRTPHATGAPHPAASAGHFDALMRSPRYAPQGPRMPDGTRGFTMGRGRPSPAAAVLRSSPARAVAAPGPAAVMI